MSEPFLAEIRMVGFNFAPRGWAFCNGQILPINQNQSLYALLGTTYGGDGRTSFALPDLRGRSPLDIGENSSAGVDHRLGSKGGVVDVVLSAAEMPQHTHELRATTTAGATGEPADKVLSASPDKLYHAASTGAERVPLSASSIGSTGGGQAHDNHMPYLAVNFCIALQGLFPSRN